MLGQCESVWNELTNSDEALRGCILSNNWPLTRDPDPQASAEAARKWRREQIIGVIHLKLLIDQRAAGFSTPSMKR